MDTTKRSDPSITAAPPASSPSGSVTPASEAPVPAPAVPAPRLPDPLPAPSRGGSYVDGTLVHETVEDGPTGVPKKE